MMIEAGRFDEEFTRIGPALPDDGWCDGHVGSAGGEVCLYSERKMAVWMVGLGSWGPKLGLEYWEGKLSQELMVAAMRDIRPTSKKAVCGRGHSQDESFVRWLLGVGCEMGWCPSSTMDQVGAHLSMPPSYRSIPAATAWDEDWAPTEKRKKNQRLHLIPSR